MRSYALPAAIGLMIVALGTAAASHVAKRSLKLVPAEGMHLLSQVPAKVGEWISVPAVVEAVQPSLIDALGRPILVYDQLETRSFRRADGTTLMLMLAYRRQQHQEDRVHVPELCYFAQGYVLEKVHDVPLQTSGGQIMARGFTAEGTERREEVVYWIRTGELVSNEAMRVRWEIFRQGVRGRLLDGLLVRASIVRPNGAPVTPAEDEAILRAFLAQLVSASSPRLATMLTGFSPQASDAGVRSRGMAPG